MTYLCGFQEKLKGQFLLGLEEHTKKEKGGEKERRVFPLLLGQPSENCRLPEMAPLDRPQILTACS